MANNPTRRKTGRQYRPVLWIACEGLAEKEYFSRRGVMPEEYSVKAYYRQGRSDPRQTVGLLLEKSARKRPGDLLWAVFDREDRQARPDAVIQQAADTAEANGARPPSATLASSCGFCCISSRQTHTWRMRRRRGCSGIGQDMTSMSQEGR